MSSSVKIHKLSEKSLKYFPQLTGKIKHPASDLPLTALDRPPTGQEVTWNIERLQSLTPAEQSLAH